MLRIINDWNSLPKEIMIICIISGLLNLNLIYFGNNITGFVLKSANEFVLQDFCLIYNLKIPLIDLM